jgi:hypothetical protein
MTENSSNLTDVFAMAADNAGMFADEQHEQDLGNKLKDLFDEAVKEVPDGLDEEQANELVTNRMLALLDQSFKAGMIYYGSFVEPPPNGNREEVRQTVHISPEDAVKLLTGLMGNGVIVQVDRGHTA